MSEPLLVRAARCEPVERTPVWFMRQAGRSLPEYRALRERYSFFDLGGTPELCAEVTLQPVRRLGVDAAVLFADIMTPVVAMGVDVELVEGVGPGIAEPGAPGAGCACGRRLAAADPGRLRPGDRRRPADPRGARFGARAARLLRRPVHGRRVSGRGQAEPRLPARQRADVPRSARLARADEEARRGLRRVRSRAGRRGRRRD